MTTSLTAARESNIAGDATMRLVADIGVLFLGFTTSLITARALGPSGRGTLAALGFLAGLLGLLATAGLGEAAVVWFGRKGITLQSAVSGVLPAVAAASLLAMMVLAGIGMVSFPTQLNVRLAIAAACLSVMVAGGGTVLGRAINAVGNFGLTSIGLVIQAGVTMGATAIFLLALQLGVFGAMVAILLGAAAQALVLIARSRRLQLRLVPRFDRLLLRETIPYGARVLVSDTLGILAGRLDLFFVYLVASHAAAGRYSVALTISGLVGLAPFALGYVTFQRIAAQSDSEGLALIARSCRIGFVLAAFTAGVLAIVAIPLIPLVFGSQYTGAVIPALLLLVGSFVSSIQSILSRAVAAQGNPGLTARSAAATVLVMMAADGLLVPTLGIVGAGIGWCLGSAAGLLICCLYYGKRHGAVFLRSLLPNAADVVDLVTASKNAVRLVIASRRTN